MGAPWIKPTGGSPGYRVGVTFTLLKSELAGVHDILDMHGVDYVEYGYCIMLTHSWPTQLTVM